MEAERPRSSPANWLRAASAALTVLLLAVPAAGLASGGPGGLAGLTSSAPYKPARVGAGSGSQRPDSTRGHASASRSGAQQGFNTAWSGLIDVADEHTAFRSVAATFTVPAVTCTSPGSAVALWAGLDGYPHGNPTIEQVGIAADCVQTIVSGDYPRYFAWYQMGPGGPVLRHEVHAGDTVSVSVTYDSSIRRYQLTLTDNRTAAADIHASVPCPSAFTCHNSSAEVIAEDPGGGYAYGGALANFGIADFTDVVVTSADGTSGTLRGNSRWHVQAEAMVDTRDDVVAQPSGEAGGAAFSVTYTPDLV
jgi:hypothetical protein